MPGYTRFVYHHDHVAFQTDSTGTIGLRFTWGLGTDDLRAVTDAAGQAYYVVQDKLGSVRGLFERNGTWRASVRFTPYGDMVALDSAGPKPPLWYAWTGREFDEETGWFYHRARYYSPLVRRFVQEDPIGHAGGENLYSYVEGQPLEATDPSGSNMCHVVRCGSGGSAAAYAPEGVPGMGGGAGLWAETLALNGYQSAYTEGRSLGNDVWGAQRSGFTVSQIDNYRSAGVVSTWERSSTGLTIRYVPGSNSAFVDRPLRLNTLDREDLANSAGLCWPCLRAAYAAYQLATNPRLREGLEKAVRGISAKFRNDATIVQLNSGKFAVRWKVPGGAGTSYSRYFTIVDRFGRIIRKFKDNFQNGRFWYRNELK